MNSWSKKLQQQCSWLYHVSRIVNKSVQNTPKYTILKANKKNSGEGT